MKYCKCGCRQIVKNKYIRGHNRKGTHLTEKHKQKTSKALKKYYKEYPDANAGKNCSGYIDGRSLKKFYCMDCGKEIGWTSKRCKSCSKKGNRNPSKNPAVRKKISIAHSGENSWKWQGGKSFEPYSVAFNNNLKELIRDRDNRICQKCGKTEKENNRKLDIHHINGVKKDCDVKNLISLCRSCHSKLHNFP